ncbi:MAG: ribosome maturation factor RimP [Syntrophomonadaceae bacterium]|nr:ribosome maturation factor RimP [Syntrophomonadaceae bacterium]
MGRKNLQELTSQIESRLALMNIELVDIEYRKESEGQMLRIYIDQDSGVDLDACAKASRAVKSIIDEKDLYYDHMEVSSPGLDRVLKNERDFIRFMGCGIRVNTTKGFDGPRKLSGVLAGYSEESINIKVSEQFVEIPREQISMVRLRPEE